MRQKELNKGDNVIYKGEIAVVVSLSLNFLIIRVGDNEIKVSYSNVSKSE